MAKNTKAFQIINGFRQSSAVFNKKHRGHSPIPNHGGDLPHSDLEEPGNNELSAALKTWQRRVSSLLEDRNSIGRNLHDCVLQSLYAIGLNLEALHSLSPSQIPQSERSHDHIVEQLNQLIHEVRHMIQSLEQGVIQEFDLTSELFTLRTTYEQICPLRVGLDLHPDAIEVLTNQEEEEVLNIVREALSNCARHAKASQAIVTIRTRGTKIRVSVSDDGVGFVTTDRGRRGYGLVNMDARTRRIGGKFRVRSAVGRGTTVIAEFSLAPILAPQ